MVYDMTNGNNKLVLTESKMALPCSEDMGFCSGEDYFETEIHSPTDNSEDSVEVKISPISLKNKRKLVEPSRKSADIATGPLKKRMCFKVKTENAEANTPFRPWSPPPAKSTPVNGLNNFIVPFPVKQEVKPEITAPTSYFRPPSPPTRLFQDEPVALVVKREQKPENSDIRVPIHPQIAKLSTVETERMILKTNEHFPLLQNNISQPYSPEPTPSTSSAARKAEQRRDQRNYKNMTRERRIEANARERTRVHTISAAFDTLRRSIPAYSHNQKLSKLSVLRIACSYIMTLSNLVSDDQTAVPEYVDMVSRTIQKEGKLRKKKDDDND